jgi:hypothetical protein
MPVGSQKKWGETEKPPFFAIKKKRCKLDF